MHDLGDQTILVLKTSLALTSSKSFKLDLTLSLNFSSEGDETYIMRVVRLVESVYAQQWQPAEQVPYTMEWLLLLSLLLLLLSDIQSTPMHVILHLCPTSCSSLSTQAVSQSSICLQCSFLSSLSGDLLLILWGPARMPCSLGKCCKFPLSPFPLGIPFGQGWRVGW